MAKTLPPTNPPSSLRYSKRNAEKHRYFSGEFVLSEAELPEFRRLERDVLKQFVPQTVLQRVAADAVVCCCWRCRRAMQAEMRSWSRLTTTEPDTPEPGDSSPGVSGWFLAKPATIRQAIRFLESVIADYQQNGILRESVKTDLERGFGPDFVEALTKWAPRDPSSAQLAAALEAHARNFNLAVPEELLEGDQKAVVDPKAGQQMVLKLLEIQRNHLVNFQQYRDLASSTQMATRPAEAPRYFAAAMRDLKEAVAFFYTLREAGL